MSGSIIPSTERRWRAALLLAALVAALCFAVDVRNTVTNGAVDLRCRVVSARVWLAGHDPYLHKWQPGMPATWLDPMDLTGLRVSRLGATPPVVLLHTPTAGWPYRLQRIAWLGVQWLLLLGTFLLLAKAAGSRERARLVWLAGILIVVPSHVWRIHVERGQVHVLWPFLIAAAYLLCRSGGPRNRVLGGTLLGLTTALRPPMLLLFLPMLLRSRRRELAGGALGILAGLLLPLAVGDLVVWRNYATGMAAFKELHLGLNANPIDPWEMRQVRHAWPLWIEGESTSLLARAANLPTVDSSAQAILRDYFGLVLFPPTLFALGVLAVAGLSALFWRRVHGGTDTTAFFLWGTLIQVVVELFLPAQHYSYTNITWLLPLCFAMLHADPVRLRQTHLHLLPVAGGLFMVASGWSVTGVLAAEGAVLLYLVLLAAAVSGGVTTEHLAANRMPGPG